jgi:uncharacterized protein (DUF2252 family)
MIEEIMLGYEEALAENDPDLRRRRPKCVQLVMRQAFRRTWENLANERIEDERPTIPLGKRFWPLSAEEREEIDRLFATEEARRLVTALRSRKNDARVEVLDAAYWMKGCSSLGRLRFAVLLGVGKKPGKKGDLCLIDIKEAAQAAAPRRAKATMPRDNARASSKARGICAPALGERMLAARSRPGCAHAGAATSRPQARGRPDQPRGGGEGGSPSASWSVGRMPGNATRRARKMV